MQILKTSLVVLGLLLISCWGFAQLDPIGVSQQTDFEQGYLQGQQDTIYQILIQLQQSGFVTITVPISENQTRIVYLFPIVEQSKAVEMAELLYGGEWIEEPNGTIRRPNLNDFRGDR